MTLYKKRKPTDAFSEKELLNIFNEYLECNSCAKRTTSDAKKAFRLICEDAIYRFNANENEE